MSRIFDNLKISNTIITANVVPTIISNNITTNYLYLKTPDVGMISIPSGITSMTVKMWGAGGSCNGGSGAYTTVTMNVSQGQLFFITVGQAVGTAGGNRASGAGGTGNYNGYGGQYTALHQYKNGLFYLIACAAGGGAGYPSTSSGGGGGGGNNGNPPSGNISTAGSNGIGGTSLFNNGQNYNPNAISIGVPKLSLMNGNGGNGGGGSNIAGGGGGYGGGGGGGASGGHGAAGGGNYIPPVAGNITAASGTNGNDGVFPNQVNPPNITDTDYIAAGGNFATGGSDFSISGGIGKSGFAAVNFGNFSYNSILSQYGELTYKDTSGTRILTITDGSFSTYNNLLDDGIGNGTFSNNLYVNNNLTVGGLNSNTGLLTFNNSTNINTVSLRPGVTSSTYALTLPSALPSNTKLLLSDSSGNLSFTETKLSSVNTYTTTTTLTSNDNFVNANGTLTLTLPSATSNPGQIIFIFNIGTGTVTINTAGSDTINGIGNTFNSTIQYTRYLFISNGAGIWTQSNI